MRSLFATALVCGASAGCFDAAVGEAVIACASDDDCPEPLFCAAAVCRRGSADDVTPPGIEPDSVRFGALAIRPGGSTTLAFAPTEPLGGVPALSGADLVFGDVAGDDGGFTVDVTARADASDGGHDVDVVLVDVAGNGSEPLRLGTLTVDGTAPTVSTVDAPDELQIGVDWVVVVTASEPLARLTCETTTIPASATPAVDGALDGSRGTCRVPVTLGLGGTFSLDVILEDPAGNRHRDDGVASAVVLP